MRNTFFPVKKPVKLGRVTLFLIFDALVPIFPPKVSAQVQVHPNLKTIFWGFKNPKKSAVLALQTRAEERCNVTDAIVSRQCHSRTQKSTLE